MVGALLVCVYRRKRRGMAADAFFGVLPLARSTTLNGHVAAQWCAYPTCSVNSSKPLLCLIASGGHTMLCRVDDAGRSRYRAFASLGHDGPCEVRFAKGARMLGSATRAAPRSSAGLVVPGRHARVRLPTRRASPLDFSFAGLKIALLWFFYTSAARSADDPPRATSPPPTSARSSKALTERPERALQETGLARLALGGGGAANAADRERASTLPPTSTSRRSRCAPTTRPMTQKRAGSCRRCRYPRISRRRVRTGEGGGGGGTA